jgi:O-acetylserine/cysteine efflux transporter
MRALPRDPVGALVVASSLWGLALTGSKYALGGFDPFTLILVELAAATAVLWAVLLAQGFRLPRSWKLAATLGLLEPGIAYLAEDFGLAHTSAAHGAIISGLESAFVVVLAALVLRERITRSTALAVFLAFVGLLVLQGGNPLHGAGTGDLWVAVGVLSASAYTVVLKRCDQDSEADSLALTTIQFTSATALALSVVSLRWFAGKSPLPAVVPLRFWLVAAAVGVFGFAASFLIFNATIARIQAGAASIVLNLIPVFGVVSAMIILGEALSPAAVGGAALIAASVVSFVIVELRVAGSEESIALEDRFGVVPIQAGSPELSLAGD